jgi:hypothetical protein
MKQIEKDGNPQEVLEDLRILRERSDDPYSQDREKLLGRLSNMATSLVYSASTPKILEKSSAVTTEFFARIYRAESREEFDLIQIGIQQLEDAIDKEKQEQEAQKAREARARNLAFLVSGMVLIGVVLTVVFGPGRGWSADTVIPIIQAPFAILFWSVIGSFAAVLYRFNTANINLQEPTKWLITRPLIGVLMGIIAYYVISVGFVIVTTGSDTEAVIAPQVLWLAAFIVSFSDQLAEKFLRTIAGKFGGDENEELHQPAVEDRVQEQLPALTASLLEYHLATTAQQQEAQNTANGQEEASTEEQPKTEEVSSSDGNTPVRPAPDNTDAPNR